MCDFRTQPTVWPGLHKNQETLGELWVGLLRFYTEEFRFNEHVICIRRLAPLTKFEKLWNRFGIAIEDPFNLQHNLGTGVSRKSENLFSLLGNLDGVQGYIHFRFVASTKCSLSANEVVV